MLFGLCIVLASCGGQSGPSGGNGPLPTASLMASPPMIVAGQSFTLTWVATNADMGTIDSGVGQVGLNGSTVLTPSTPGYPTATTTYTYTATGPGGTATATAVVTVSLVTSFDGMVQSEGSVTNDDVDPNGAVGILQYMEYINSSYQAYDKVTNTAVWPKPQPIETLWANNPPCYKGSNGTTSAIQLDVQIIYDRLASRWVVVGHTSESNNYYMCIAVSSIDDLRSATWGAYSYKLEPNLGIDGSIFDLPDWPKVGTWPDGYYIAMDEIDQVLNQEVGVVVCAFDRPDILNNPLNIKSPACLTMPNVSSTSLDLGHSLIPADVDGTNPPPAGRDEFMVSIENPPFVIGDGFTQTPSTTFNLWDFHVDWTATPPTLTLVQQSTPTVTAYIPGCYLYVSDSPSITNCVPENRSNGPEIVDSVGDRFMPRFAYRNYGSYESFLISHTVQTGPGPSGTTPAAYQTGIRWYQLTDNGSGTPSVSQSGTINPDASLYRFLPSIAQDHSGNVAVGYSTSNALSNPGINFSYWNLTESASTTPTEVTIINGPGEEVTPVTTVGKWGSYSSMTVDPGDDCTFWYVNEYFFSDNAWRTRIANFKLPNCK